MASCTIFKNFTVPVENKSLIVISKDIASDKYKAEAEGNSILLAQGLEEEAKAKEAKTSCFHSIGNIQGSTIAPKHGAIQWLHSP